MTIRIPRWVFGCIGLLAFLWFIWLLGPRPYARENRKSEQCQKQLEAITLACLQYKQDADGHFPPVVSADFKGWADILRPYYESRAIFQCPNGTPTQWERTSDYFYNANLATHSGVKAPETVVLFGDGPDNGGTDSHLSALPTGWDELLPANYDDFNDPLPSRRHVFGANYIFVDGHVKCLLPYKVHALRFKDTH